MKLHQLRSATLLLTLGEHTFLVDPMLGDAGSMPGFKMFGGGRRPNPLVSLPPGAGDALEHVTAAIVTHEHPDHLDAAGVRFLRERGLSVWTNGIDAASLEKRGLDVHLLGDGALGMRVETIRSRHGRGLVGWMMGPVCGYFISCPGEPSLYLIGDSVLTDPVLEAIGRLQPDVIVAPAGAANMGLGGDILFSVDELFTLASAARGQVVLNHLEALDHCPTTRADLRARVLAEGLGSRVHVPEDGETLSFTERSPVDVPAPLPHQVEKPGFQKWVTAHLAGG